MRKRKKIIPLIVLLVAASLAIAGNYTDWFKVDNDQPDAKHEYQKLYERYMHNDSVIHLKGTVVLYDGEQPSEIKEQSSFVYLKKGRQFYSQLLHLQTWYNGKLMLQLDTLNRMVVVSAASANETPADPGQLSLDMLFSDTASFKISGTVSGDQHERTLTCQSDFNPEIKTIRLVYEPSGYQLRKAEIEWWKDAQATDPSSATNVWITQISYQHLPFKEWQADEWINRIITVKKDRVELTSKYKDYTLHDLTSEP